MNKQIITAISIAAGILIILASFPSVAASSPREKIIEKYGDLSQFDASSFKSCCLPSRVFFILIIGFLLLFYYWWLLLWK